MVKIRLRRIGSKKNPHYRVVVTEVTAPRDGRFIEIIGHYNPRTDPVTVNIEEERALHWLSVGAQPTDSVRHLLKNQGTMDRLARLKAGASLEELLAELQPTTEEQVVEATPEPEAPVVQEEEPQAAVEEEEEEEPQAEEATPA